jgi:hypothetical protein
MLARSARLLAAGLLGACMSGCGLLYTNVVQPLDLNVDNTPMNEADGRSDWKTVNIPYIARFDWDSAAIRDAAREAGITHVHYADKKTLIVLVVWQQRWAVVYGTGPAPAATPAP